MSQRANFGLMGLGNDKPQQSLIAAARMIGARRLGDLAMARYVLSAATGW
jgi:hypothetical protein